MVKDRRIATPQWERFNNYARKVRKISLDLFTDTTGREPIWGAILPSLGDPILPFLRSATVEGSCTGFVNRNILLLIPPGISKLAFRPSLHFPTGGTEAISDLFRSLCDRLQELEIFEAQLPRTAKLDFSLLQNHTRLHSLKIGSPSLTMDQIHPLTNYRRLTNLSLALPDMPSPSARLPLDTLLVLTVRGNWKTIEQAITSLSIPHTHTITLIPEIQSLYYRYTRRKDDEHRCLSALTSDRLSSLHTLRIKALAVDSVLSGWNGGPGTNKFVVQVDDPLTTFVRPLFACRHLRSVSFALSAMSLPVISSNEYVALAIAWPIMEQFSLDIATAVAPAGLLVTLIALAEHCPCLRAARLPKLIIEDDAVEQVEAHCAKRKEGHGLQELVIGMIIAGREDPNPADLVACVFPRARFTCEFIARM